MKGPDEKCQFPGANEFRQNLLATLILRADQADGSVFLKRVADGIGLSGDTDPIFALRRQLSAEAQRRHRQTPLFHRAGIAIKAFNLWRSGDSVKLLRYAPGGTTPEEFPLIEGLDLATNHPRPSELHPRHRVIR